jgi:hypothetical protein
MAAFLLFAAVVLVGVLLLGLTYPDAIRRELLTELTTTGNLISDDCKVALYTNDATPTATSVLGDFTLATAGGSTPVAVTAWSDAYTDAAHVANQLANLIQFTATGVGDPENIYGWILTDAAGTKYLGGERFPDAPIPFGPVGTAVAVLPRLTFGQ